MEGRETDRRIQAQLSKDTEIVFDMFADCIKSINQAESWTRGQAC